MTKETQSPLAQLLPIKMVVVTLQFLRPTILHFFHQPALGAFCYTLLGGQSQYDRNLIINAVESGRTRYETGALYHFSLTILKGGDEVFHQLMQALVALPNSGSKIDPGCAFSDNVEFVECRDLLGGERLRDIDSALPYTMHSLMAETDLWQASNLSIVMRWLSPVRLKREKAFIAQAKPNGEERYCRDGEHLTLPLLFSRIHNAAINRLPDNSARFPHPGDLPDIDFVSCNVFWVHASYSNRSGRYTPMGGLAGVVRIPPPSQFDPAWLPWLVLGQYFCLGERRNFGWGRYRLETDDRTTTLSTAHPAQSLLVKAAAKDNVLWAWEVIENNRSNVGGQDDIDETDPLSASFETNDDTDQDPPEDLLNRISERIASGTYNPPPLNGYVIPKKDGGLRALAVPPFSDRVAQRAVVQILSNMLEPFMAASSHGYRKGHSRITAKEDITRAFKDGYRWVYEADISAFFNNVDRISLDHRLRALYGDDPVVDLILKWMAADVIYNGRTIQRPWGIPQGSPISPLMANLMLDDLDRDLHHAGFRLIRYADDFVVLCRSKERAEQAVVEVERSLDEIGLSVNPEKSGIVSLDQGFRFLGYFFQNNLVLDASGEKPRHKKKTQPPSNYWLSQLQKESRVSSLDPDTILEHKRVDNDVGVPDAIGERKQQGMTLFVNGEMVSLSTLNNRLVVTKDQVKIADYAWRNLGSLVLIGPHRITTPALRTAMRFGVPIHFMSRSGRYQGIAANQNPTREGHRLWLQQLAIFSQPDAALLLAREIVSARLRHQREVLRLIDGQGLASQRSEIMTLSRKLRSAATIQQLNGYEGRAAAAYFDALKTLIPSDWGFDKRINQHAPDPFNAMLSLGYTILYQYVDALIRTDGLYPWAGFYHQGRGNHSALASDMMEPFRHLVERVAISAIRKKTVQLSQFGWNRSKDRMELDHVSRKTYLAALSARLNEEYQSTADEKLTYVEAIHQQNISLRDHVRYGYKFTSWRMR